MARNNECFIWCDESIKKGKYYSNFYGGLLVQSKDIKKVEERINNTIIELGIIEEIKWAKVDAVKLPAFLKLMETLFDLVDENKVKIRVMFTQNANVPKGLSHEHYENEYFILYYEFFKHAFGLPYSNGGNEVNKYIRAYFDYLPDTRSKCQQFKEYIKGLESNIEFKKAKIKFRKDAITEINSKEHLPLQLLDVVLGAMQFRLNDKHKEKNPETNRRGKRTIAKEKLYKYILCRLRELRPHFNIGISTGFDGDASNKWSHPYRHWCFKAKDYEIDESQYK